MPILKEIDIYPLKAWVIKKVKHYSDLNSVPYDIANQHIASVFANEFSKVLDSVFEGQDIYIKYIQPFLAIPMFR